MITAESHRQPALLCMLADGLCDRLADAGDETGVLQLADGRIAQSVDLPKLEIPIELDIPAKFYELMRQSGFNKVVGSFVHTEPGLPHRNSIQIDSVLPWCVAHTWPPLESSNTCIGHVFSAGLVVTLKLNAHLNGQPTIFQMIRTG